MLRIWKATINSRNGLAFAFRSEQAVREEIVAILLSLPLAWFVGATDGGALRRLIPDKRKHRELAELLDGPQVKRIMFAVNWVVPEAMLPRGMGQLVLMQPRDAALGPILVQVAQARRAPGEPTAGEDERTVTAGLFVEANLRGFRAGLAAARDLRPFDASLP